MKIRNIINPELAEMEVHIYSKADDIETKRLSTYIAEYDQQIKGYKDGCEYRIRLVDVFYIEAVDGSSFLSTADNTYDLKISLSTIESALSGTSIMRISKSMLINLNKLKSVTPYPNHRLNGELSNGEHVIISRSYISNLKKRLEGE